MEKASVRFSGNLPGSELLEASFKRHSFARHYHDTLALGLIEQGIGKSFFRGEYLLAPPGEVMVYRPGEVHSGGPGCDEGWTYHMLYLSKDCLTRLGFEHLYEAHFSTMTIRDQELGRRFRELVEGYCQPSGDSDWRMSELLEQLGKHTTAPLRSRTPVTAEALYRVRDYLHANLNQEVSVQELGHLVGYNPYHLSRSFRQMFGLPPHAYQMNMRIEKAKERLARGRLASEISLDLGFYDQSHFTMHFKRHVGVTPARYAEVHVK